MCSLVTDMGTPSQVTVYYDTKVTLCLTGLDGAAIDLTAYGNRLASFLSRDLLNNVHNDGAIVVAVSFRILAGISSGAGALLGSSDLRSASTS